MKKISQPISPSLRSRAEEILKSRLPITVLPQTEAETLKLIYELQLNQLELELQNKELMQAQNAEYIQINDGHTRTIEELLQAKEIAEESEKKYKLLYDFNPMPMSIFDAQTLEFLSVNEAFCDKYGFTREEFLNMTILEIRPDTEMEKLKQSVSQIDKGITNAGIFLHKKKNGEIIQVEITRHELIFDNRNAKLVLINDVTDKLKAEAILMETQLKLNEAYKLAHIGIWEWEIVTDTVIWTEELYHIAGLDPMLPAPSYKEQATLYSPESWKVLNSLVQRTFKTSESYQTELELIRPGGEIRYAKAFGGAKLDANGQLKGLFGTLQDITELKKAEAALHAKHELFRKTFNISPLASVLAKLPERTIVEVNPAFESLVGYASAEVIGKPVNELGMWADTSEQERVSNILLANGKVHNVEFVFKTKTGETGNGIFYSEVIEQLNEKYVLTKVMDITERKRAEEALLKSEILLSETEKIGKVGGWEFNIDTMNTTWTDEVYTIHEVEINSKQNVEKGINFYTPESRPVIEKAVQRAIQFGEPFDLELEIITAKGNRRNVHTIGNADLENRRVYGFFQDITDRKLAEEELRENEEKFRLLYTSMGQGLSLAEIITDLDGNPVDYIYLDINDSYTKLFGVTHESIGKRVRELFPEIEQYWIDVFGKVALTGEPVYYENYFETTGKHYSTYTYSPKKNQFANLVSDITERKQAEEALKENNSRLELAMQSANMAWWEMDITTGKVIFDQRKSEMLGYPAEKFRHYKDFMALVHAEDSGKAMQAMQRHIDGKSDKYEVEYRILTLSGEYKWFYDIGAIVKKDSNGKPLNAAGLVIDITKRKQAEELLREREYLLSSSQRAAHVGTWSWKLGDANVYWSDETYRIYGLSPEMGSPDFEFFFEIIHPEDRHKMREWPEAVIAGLHPSPVEFRVLRPDGIYRVIRTEGDVIETVNGVPSRIAGTAYDITERKEAEEKIRELNERIATATSSAQVGIWDWDVVNNLLVWDDQMYALYGLKKDDFKGAYESWVNGLHPEDREYCENEVKLAFLGEKEYDAEFRIIWPDGTVRYSKSKGEVFRDETGVPMRMLGVNYDITDRKQIEAEIKNLNETLEQRVVERTNQLEAANKELEAFSYSVSHDLRAPLRHINGFVDLLNERYIDLLPEKGKHYLSVITDASSQMGNLIDDLLQFSRTGRQEMQKINLNMNPILKEVLEFFAEDNRNRKIDWEITKMPIITGDMSLLRMVWVNLISNAVKFTSDRDTAKIVIGYTEENKEFIFYIRDNGAGFDMRYAHKLFGVFQRLHTKEQFEGTGIGLANVQRIILKHGGRCWAESELNNGATFYFTIPKVKENL